MTLRKRIRWPWATRFPLVSIPPQAVRSFARTALPLVSEAAMNDKLSPASVTPSASSTLAAPVAPAVLPAAATPAAATPKAPPSRRSISQPVPFSKVFQRQASPGQPQDEWPAEAFWYAVLLVGCASVALMLWGAYSALPRPANPEKSLRAEHVVPKLKGELREETPILQVASVEPPFLPVSAPMSAKPSLPPVSLAPLPLAPVPVPEPVKVELPRFDLPRPVAPVQEVTPALPLHQDPLVYVRANLGDTPMLRTWRTLTLYSLLALTPVPVAAQEDPKLQERLDKLEKLIKNVSDSLVSVSTSIDGLKADMKKDLAGVNAAVVQLRVDMDGSQTRMKNLEDLVGNIRADVTFLQRRLNEGVSPAAPVDKAGLDDLRKQLRSIEDALAKLRAAEPPTGRIALSPPSPNGRIVLANMYYEELLFVINQRTHRVPPGSVQTLENVPAGTLTYEVLSPTWGLRARESRNLPANETFTLTAR
jgi:hypothetical protein